MENAKTKTILALIVILFLLVGTFFAVTFLNKTNLIIHAEPPYTIVVKGAAMDFCEESPCIIELGKGQYEVEIEKPGYKNVQFEVMLKSRETHEEEIEFEFISYMEDVNEIEGQKIFQDEGEALISLKDKGEKQALYMTNEDYEENLIAYFASPIGDHDLKLMNDGETIAIIEHADKDSIYLVNSKTSSRTKIAVRDEKIVDIKCSYDSVWCLLESDQTELVNTKTNKTKDMKERSISLGQMTWGNEELFMVAKYELEDQTEKMFYVQKFNPDTDEFTNIFTTSELAEAPDKIKLSADENALYLKIGTQYKVVKF